MLITGSHKGALISAYFKISQSQLCMQFFLFKYHYTYLDCMTSMEMLNSEMIIHGQRNFKCNYCMTSDKVLIHTYVVK